MSFGMCNAISCYERLIELVLRGLRWEKCLLDDIIVFGSSFDQALKNLKLVFDRLVSANLTLKPSKYVLFQREVSFLGHVVSDKGIQCDPSKIDKVKKWPVPSNVTEVRSFLGLAGYYRRPGKFHCNADSLSRRPSNYCKREDCPDCHLRNCVDSGGRTGAPQQTDIILLSWASKIAPVGTDQWFNSAESGSHNSVDDNGDDSCDVVSNWLDTWHVVLDASTDLKTFWGLWESLEVKESMLYYKWKSLVDKETLLLIAPRHIRSQIFHELHENKTAGHFGRERTIKSFKRRVYWPGMSSDIKRWCKECDVCARAKVEVLDLTVLEEEMEELVGQEWPNEGQQCPVENCKSRPHRFQRIGSFRTHNFHTPKILVYYCIVRSPHLK
ncbi:uncharacterized protein LOC133192385 [Saccostrea echinata]|uniref:uncharacterized protein LOC133192385 n=1 Tax=Saccostrea echinata TaxID=191078 RepID=UPI002A8013A1|nr:uncharacterized protein LOC133192385 [Saccostrea echinata]